MMIDIALSKLEVWMAGWHVFNATIRRVDPDNGTHHSSPAADVHELSLHAL